MKNLSLFEDQRQTLENSIALTAETLKEYLPKYKYIAISFSGGKDSSALVTVIAHLIDTKQIPRPENLVVLYADTRMELPPLQISAFDILKKMEARGFETRKVCAPIDKRFLVYILGRGVPPPNNSTLRWCTRQIKVDPMTAALSDLRSRLLPDEKLLMLTGVRIGESAVRDARIAVSCSKNGAECGQGWFQSITAPQTDTLAPILHFRVCHVWEWLWLHAPSMGFDTSILAEAYGGEEAEEINARTGCVGCPLTSKDVALDGVIKQPAWEYLKPLKQLRLIFKEMRSFENRLQKTATETRKDGTLVSNPGRKGPLTLEARERFLEEILLVQNGVNEKAIALNRPTIDLINTEEEARIRELIALETFPNGWSGKEHRGDVLLPSVYPDGSVQPLLWEVSP